jgi:lysophospholipase L1-like esterase
MAHYLSRVGPDRKWNRSAARMIMLSLFMLAVPMRAAPFRLLVIGDSLSEEYRFETPFSAPSNNPAVANTKNWVELLLTHRNTDFAMGSYEPSLGNYADFRNAGYEYNYGIPGFKAERWNELLYRSYSFFDLLNPENIISLSTRVELNGDLSSVDAILIFIGGNDLSLTDTDAQHDLIRQHIVSIRSYIRNKAPTGKPIIIATVPDIGASPAEKLTNPTQAAAARQRVATLNANIAALGSLPNTYIARIDHITNRIYDQVPFHINGTLFNYPPENQNLPLSLFCRDGFHPGTAVQALFANEILRAINLFATTPISLLSNREILAQILSQNPDQPYLTWAGSAGAMTANPDNDSLPNLVEFLLGTDPRKPDSGFNFLPDGTASYTPSTAAIRFADLSVLQSTTLENDWLPAQNVQLLPGGSVNLIPSGPKHFYKFAATPKP